MSGPATVRTVTLEQAIAEVEREVAAEAITTGTYADDPANWHRHNREAMAALGKRLESSVGAKVNDRWDGCKVRIAGVSASSTSGISGALRNWLRSARRKIA